MLEESVDEGDKLQKILIKVNRGIEDKRIDENNFRQVHAEMLKIKRDQQMVCNCCTKLLIPSKIYFTYFTRFTRTVETVLFAVILTR